MSHHTNDPTIKCCCDSGLSTEDIYDERGIFVARACAKCKKEKLSGYRSEIFDNACYETDEIIEPEDGI